MPRKRPARPVKPVAERTKATNVPLCRSCGKRPGRPMTMIGQLTQTVLCEPCAELRKERIRSNRAAARAGASRVR